MRAINTFWNWFQDNNQTIQNLINETPKNQKHILFWINKHLGYYCKEIDFLIVFPKNGNTKSKLIITANGNITYFRQVADLIDNAPQLRNWKFTAFIQSIQKINQIINELEQPYIIQEVTLKTNEPKFLPLKYDLQTNKIDIIIFVKNYHLYCDTKTLEQAIFIIMQDQRVGSSLYININFVQLKQLPKNYDLVRDFIHLYEFEIHLDKYRLKQNQAARF
jgi:hypothetical protein